MNKFIEVDGKIIRADTIKKVCVQACYCRIITNDEEITLDWQMYDKIRKQLFEKDDRDILKELLCKIEKNVTESKKKAADPSYSEHEKNIYLGMAGAYADVGIYLRENIPQSDTQSDTQLWEW